MNYIDFLIEILAANIWPLSFLLISLLVLKRIKDDVRPIFLGMVAPLTKQAQTNAIAWTAGQPPREQPTTHIVLHHF